MSDQVDKKVKPCPICGHEAEIERVDKGRFGWVIRCGMYCYKVFGATRKAALERWNYRPLAQAKDAEIAALKERVEELDSQIIMLLRYSDHAVACSTFKYAGSECNCGLQYAHDLTKPKEQ